uniref:FepA family TonB-dependent siderophore receptor n=1 Tax=Acidovorax sp. TaxID=1872122 RepID=UPI002616925D
ELSYRLYGNVNKTEADSLDLNSPFSTGTTPPAGREGVLNRDANMQLRWAPHQQESVDLNLAWSRQGNIYAGDRAMNSAYEGLSTLAEAGAETNTKLRRSAALVHRKNWGERRSSRITLSYEGTDDTRLREGLSGGSEGAFVRDPANSQLAALQTSTSQLRNVWMNGEFSTPWHIAGLDQMLTLGVENQQERLDDPYAMSNANAALGVLSGRSSQASARTTAFFVESNIAATDKLLLTPGLRYDRHSQFGGNWSPSLNASQQITAAVSLKAGIARAFKAPNLYQSNPNYLWETNGNGSPVNWPRPNGSGCSILGNPDLKPETSVNKEIGIAYDAEGMQAGLTYFHNDYRNKVVADMPDQTPVLLSSGRYLFRWANAERAVVRGLEGHWAVPVGTGRALRWSNNFTYMLDNRNGTTGQPLATVPRYTVNSSLDWQVDERLSALFTATFYGQQEPLSRNLNGTSVTGDAALERGSYALFGASVGYRLYAGATARFGISNLFDKRLFREHNQAGAGANTYNEAGRAFYASLQATF